MAYESKKVYINCSFIICTIAMSVPYTFEVLRHVRGMPTVADLTMCIQVYWSCTFHVYSSHLHGIVS